MFSISQIEKAFGHGYEQLALVTTVRTDPFAPPIYRPRSVRDDGLSPIERGDSSACLRAWALRYIAGLKEPEFTWEQACALPEGTETEKKYKAGAKARTWGKVAEIDLERYIRSDPSIATRPLSAHVVAGLNLLPHPSDLLDCELQAPVNVRTTPEAIGWGKSAIPSELGPAVVSWQGFKDFRGRARHISGGDGWRFLIDFKTTKPKVDNAYNAEHGRPAGTWRYRKLPNQLILDWQYNLYAWDDYLKYGELPISRWVYFASPGSDRYPNRPEACASDMPDTSAAALEIVRQVVRALDARGRELLGHVRNVQQLVLPGWLPEQKAAAQLEYAMSLPGNPSACDAFGGQPCHVRLGGPCDGCSNGVIPVARLNPTKRIQQTKPAEPVFTVQPFPGDNMPSVPSVIDQIKAQMAANQGQQPPAVNPPAQAPWGPPPPAAQPWGAQPPPTATPQFGQPGFAFNPGAAAPVAQAPVQAPPPPPAPTHASPFGTPATPGWICDGQGGYVAVAQLPAMAAAGHPGARALLAPPTPAVAPSPTPGLPPEAFAPGGPAGPPVVETPAGAGSPVPPQPAPPPLGAAAGGEAPKKGRGRPKKDPGATPAGGVDAEPEAGTVWDRIADALERIAAKIGA